MEEATVVIEKADSPSQKKSKAVVTVKATPAKPAMTKERAQELDNHITSGFRELGQSMAVAYLGMASQLAEMKRRKGYEHLGFDTWQEYLDKKIGYTKGQISSIMKLAKGRNTIEDIKVALGDTKLGGSQLLEFTRATSYAGMIPELIREAKEQVAGKTVSKTREILKGIVSQKSDVYRRKRPADAKTSLPGRTRDWDAFFTKELGKASDDEKKRAYLEEMTRFLEKHKAMLGGTQSGKSKKTK